MPAKTALHVIAKRPVTFGFKDKQREQRKKIIKMCVQKLRDIDDPETVLCRAVLINNTFKTLKYAQRKLQHKKLEMKRLKEEEEERKGYEQQEDEEVHEDDSSGSSSDNENDSNSDGDHSTQTGNINRTETDHPFDETLNIEDLTNRNCDINSYNAESIVHSLVMPPLLSPQLEDMTNCSFYESFSTTPQQLPAQTISSQNTEDQRFSDHISSDSDSLNGSLKMTVMKTDLCNVISESNSNLCSKSEFTNCRGEVQNDLGDSLLIDNLLTEIVQS